MCITTMSENFFHVTARTLSSHTYIEFYARAYWISNVKAVGIQCAHNTQTTECELLNWFGRELEITSIHRHVTFSLCIRSTILNVSSAREHYSRSNAQTKDKWVASAEYIQASVERVSFLRLLRKFVML